MIALGFILGILTFSAAVTALTLLNTYLYGEPRGTWCFLTVMTFAMIAMWRFLDWLAKTDRL
jgi:hypothetical protein